MNVTVRIPDELAERLAASTSADLPLMDDRAGAAGARAQGIQATGTPGVPDRAAQGGLIGLSAALVALRATNFHVGQVLLAPLLAGNRRRRGEP